MNWWTEGEDALMAVHIEQKARKEFPPWIQVWYCMSVIPALGKLREGDGRKFEANLG